MAGAGYKLFNTGDVLTAAQVNTYLMEQTVMVFNDAASRTTALTGIVAEGMLSYLKSTKQVEVYNGSAWVASDDPNAIQNTIVDAKGDLIAATANDTPARLAVGNNGETLVADSSASTGLRWQGNYSAGKNLILNGDFRINQRSFSSTTSDGTYGFDRWALGTAGGATYSAQTFTAGTAPVAGYEGINFARVATTGQSSTNTITILLQRIEDVRTLAGQTATISFWAKAGSGTPKIAVEAQQNFGSGGSTTVNTYAGQITMTTSWARYSVTVAVPSVSGKTIGTSSFLAIQLWTSAGSDFNARTGSLGIQTATIDVWGVQVEAGNVATAFQTATGTLAGELAACQRYYWRYGGDSVYQPYGTGVYENSTTATIIIQHPVTMRSTITSIDYSTLLLYDGAGTGTVTNIVGNSSGRGISSIKATIASGGTTSRVVQLLNANNSNGYLGFSAEL